MFGNHLLPNISPSHLFHLPPPSHYPAIITVPAVPLASAQMGKARAFSSKPTATSPLPHTAYATSPPMTSPTQHVTTDSHHHHWQVSMAASPLLEGCRCRNQQVWVRRSEGGGKWSEEAREWGMRRQGKWRGRGRPFVPPPSLFLIPEANKAA
jgi:hypothetical protein